MKTAVGFLEEQIIKFHNWKLNQTFDENCFDEIELNKAIQQAKEMEQKQRQHLLNYIEEVKDICGKLRFPYEEELNELTKKAEVILNQFKQEEQ